MPKVSLSLCSSFEKLFNKIPYSSMLYVFGYLCFPWLRPYSSHKLDPKSSLCVFLRYSLTQSAFLCFDLNLRKNFVSRHVKFVENVFLFMSTSTSNTPVIDADSAFPVPPITSWDSYDPPPPLCLPILLAYPILSAPVLRTSLILTPASLLPKPTEYNTPANSYLCWTYGSSSLTRLVE